MQDSELIELWRSYDRKIEENLIMNKRNAEAITIIKIRSAVSSMAPMKILMITIGTLWLSFIGVILYRTYSNASPFFWYSMAIHASILVFVIGVYVYQLVLIYQTDLSEALFTTQRRLARLKSSTLLIARLMFLHAPIWTTFSIPERIFEHPVWMTIQLVVTVFFVIVALWLFFNINYENSNKKWFAFIFRGNQWDPVIRSFEMLREMERYETN
ncbi:MAG: hypothetical protein BGO21_02240 [Dyadobacter sp. 50-39]|uniref:hypothetical protein n=1 Tax=Dyadobacter sp. 50-39 TaxID=1895756 RepID=UPI000969FDF0|nr:hypothetical protein [Dyadobacter sp. 50-39]OJV12589.1 MAG: hypothetical protein BGO21_02240 [Dyadobacter sp. 50-39]